MNTRVPTGSVSISFKPSPRIYLFILHSLVSAGPTYINLFFNHNSLSFLGTMMTDELQDLSKHSSPKVLVWKPNNFFNWTNLSAAIWGAKLDSKYYCYVQPVARNWALSNLSDKRKRKEKDNIEWYFTHVLLFYLMSPFNRIALEQNSAQTEALIQQMGVFGSEWRYGEM